MCGKADCTLDSLLQKKLCQTACIELVMLRYIRLQGCINYPHLFLLSLISRPESLKTCLTDSAISTDQYLSVVKNSKSKRHTAGALGVKGIAPPFLSHNATHTHPHRERKRHKPLQSYKFIGLEINTNILLRNCPGKTYTVISCQHSVTLVWIPDLSTQCQWKAPW